MRSRGFGNGYQAGLSDDYIFGEASVTAVTDAHAVAAPVLPTLAATVTPSAGVGQEADHVVPRLHCGHPWAHLVNHSRDFVAQDHPRLDAATQRPRHYQQVVVAEAAGRHLHQDLLGIGDGDRHIPDRQAWRAAGLLQD